jgi:clan AA aspartic protease
MGNVLVEITLKNSGDVINVNRGIIADNDVRSLTVTALVDTGATTLVINKDICNKLGLSIVNTRTVSLAGGQEAYCKITEPVRIIWKDRDTDCRAWVLPGEDEPLLGVIPLEDMDLIVDPRRQELIGAHGDVIMGRIK